MQTCTTTLVMSSQIKGACFCANHCVQVGLTWTFLNTESSVGVLGPGVVFQLEGGRVVDKWLGALGHTCPTVIEVGTSLQTDNQSPRSDGTETYLLFLLLHCA